MSASKRRTYDLILGMVFGFLFVLPIMHSRGYFDAVPFSYVELDEAVERAGVMYVTATFLKTDQCKFEKLAVFGEKLGAWHPLSWRDLDGEQGDRIEGRHTIRLAIDVDRGPYTTLEIRTRHDCDGRKKDSLFLRIDQ